MLIGDFIIEILFNLVEFYIFNKDIPRIYYFNPIKLEYCTWNIIELTIRRSLSLKSGVRNTYWNAS